MSMTSPETRQLIARAGNRELWRIVRYQQGGEEAQTIMGWRLRRVADGTTQPSPDQLVFRSEALGRDWLVAE